MDDTPAIFLRLTKDGVPGPKRHKGWRIAGIYDSRAQAAEAVKGRGGSQDWVAAEREVVEGIASGKIGFGSYLEEARVYGGHIITVPALAREINGVDRHERAAMREQYEAMNCEDYSDGPDLGDDTEASPFSP